MSNSVPAVFRIKGSASVNWDVCEYIMEHHRFQEIYSNLSFTHADQDYTDLVGCCSGGIDDRLLKQITAEWPCEIEAIGWDDADMEIWQFRFNKGEPILSESYDCDYLFEEFSEEDYANSEVKDFAYYVFSSPDSLGELITLGTDNEEPVKLTKERILEFYEHLKESEDN